MKLLGKALLCALAGFLAWVITEPFLPKSGPLGGPEWSRAELIMVTTVIIFVSLAGGFWSGLQKGGLSNILIRTGLGLVLGGACGMIGYQIAGAVFESLGGQGVRSIPQEITQRAAVFAIMGAGLGLGIGAVQLNGRSTLAGAAGGAVGGLIAGPIFVFVGSLFAVQFVIAGGGEGEVGMGGRAVLWTLLGFCIGLFTALLENVTRSAWIRLELGRNEGKEWPIDASQTNIGRDERAHVPLFGDPQVAPLHAVIQRQGANYFLADPGTPMGVGHNGNRISQPVSLQHGDTIQLAGLTLRFLMRGGTRIPTGEGRVAGVPVGPGGQMMAPTAPLQPILQANAAPQPVAQTQPSSFRLVATAGPLQGQAYVVSQDVEVGREGGLIPLNTDGQVSRKHARLSPTAAGLSVQDLGSTNGTFVNAQRTQAATLAPGDVLQIGASTFRVEKLS